MPNPKSPDDSLVDPVAARTLAAREMARLFESTPRTVITTHINADGDGCGSEVAMWHFLRSVGIEAVIVNPTPFPPRYSFLLEGCEDAERSSHSGSEIDRAELIVVLDIADLARLGHLAARIEQRGVPVACIDHHVTDGMLPPGPRVLDATACATGELVYDFIQALGWTMNLEAARALYVAILTDTGGFRFSNTSPRALRIAADLMDHGIDPEDIYRSVFASLPEGRVRLFGEVADTLMVESELGLAWMTVPNGALERHGLDADHLEGVVELPRSIAGVRLALLFRPIAKGRVKISFRSVGDVSAAGLAEQFGGGGHVQAAGASIAGDLEEVKTKVLEAARAHLAQQGAQPGQTS